MFKNKKGAFSFLWANLISVSCGLSSSDPDFSGQETAGLQSGAAGSMEGCLHSQVVLSLTSIPTKKKQMSLSTSKNVYNFILGYGHVRKQILTVARTNPKATSQYCQPALSVGLVFLFFKTRNVCWKIFNISSARGYPCGHSLLFKYLLQMDAANWKLIVV